MDASILNCILNPIRMRIIQILIKNKNLTVQQIAQELPDVPQATLYRHLNNLLKAKVIAVAKENKVRGVIEKVYTLSMNPYEAMTKELNNNNKSEYLNVFYNFVMTLLGDFEGYIQQENADLQKDGVTFRSAAVYLDDVEYEEFIGDLKKAFQKVIKNDPNSKRRLRKISTIIMPGTENQI